MERELRLMALRETDGTSCNKAAVNENRLNWI